MHTSHFLSKSLVSIIIAGLAFLPVSTQASPAVGHTTVANGVISLPGFIPEGTSASPEDAYTIVVGGVTNPRGFDWDEEGNFYLALAGTGVMPTSTSSDEVIGRSTPESEGQPKVEGAGQTQVGTNSARIARINESCAITIASGLPSGGVPDLGWVFGVDDLEFVNGHLYALIGGGGETYSHAETPNGVYQINADGSSTLIANLSAWFRANPVAEPHEPTSPDAQPFHMVAIDGVLWIVEANHQQVLTVSLDGTITRIADLSVLGNLAPTSIAPAPEGGVYIGFLSPLPFTDASARVVEVGTDGSVTDVWTGLTAVTSIAVDADGTLYALEMATSNSAEPPYIGPGTGKVVRQKSLNSAEDVVTGLTFPVKMDFGPDGGLYVGTPAFSETYDQGAIVRFDLSHNGTILVDSDNLLSSHCFSIFPGRP